MTESMQILKTVVGADIIKYDGDRMSSVAFGYPDLLDYLGVESWRVHLLQDTRCLPCCWKKLFLRLLVLIDLRL